MFYLIPFPYSDNNQFNHEQFSEWLKEVQGNTQQAFCTVCQKTLSAEITTLKRHKTSVIHSANIARKAALLESSPSTSQSADSVENCPIKDKVTRAEVKLGITIFKCSKDTS